LEAGWQKVSNHPIDGPDGRGNILRFTLIRHLTALGMTKDSVGLALLLPIQIKEIERGIASPVLAQKKGMSRRLSEIFFEIDVLKNGGNPSGNSMTQRLLFHQAAWQIAKDNFLVGVGTGDLQKAFDSYYFETDSVLNEKSRLRAHQQYLTLVISFGVLGFVLLASLLWLAPLRNHSFLHYPAIAFIIIASISFLTEDTLETQAGVTFFSWFYAGLIIAGAQVFGQGQSD